MDARYYSQPDNELELMAAGGDGDAFAELYNRHSARTYDFVVRMVRDDDEAADIVQDAFVRAMKSLKPGEHGASFSTWIFTIARNLSLTRISKRQRASAGGAGNSNRQGEAGDDPLLHVVDGDRFVNPDEAAQASDLSELVWSAAGFLNPKEASILDLHLRQDLDSAEIAEALGISKGNAYTILSRLKNTFEEAVVALTMLRSGRKECAQLDRLLAAEGSSLLSPSVRRLINGHVKECTVCQDLRSRLLSPTALFGSFALVPMPIATKLRIGEAIGAQWHAIGPAASAGTSAGSSVTQQISTWTGRASKIIGEQIRNVAVSWPYQTVIWKAAYLGVALVATAGIVGGGVAVTATRDNPPTAVLGVNQIPTPSPVSSRGASDGNTTNATPEPDADADGLTTGQGDCDDSNPAVRPGKTDIPNNSVDENCDGRDATELEPDGDGDGIPDASDSCPAQAEDFDGYEDKDGCPEGEPARGTPAPGNAGTPTLDHATTATTTPLITPTQTPRPPTPTPVVTPRATPTPTPSPGVALSAGTYSASPGGSVTVRIDLHAVGVAIGVYTIEVAYDAVAVDATACTAHPSGLCNANFSSGVVSVSGVSIGGITGDATLAEITFQIFGNASTALDVRVLQLKGPPPSVVDLSPITTVTDGRINVAP